MALCTKLLDEAGGYKGIVRNFVAYLYKNFLKYLLP